MKDNKKNVNNFYFINKAKENVSKRFSAIICSPLRMFSEAFGNDSFLKNFLESSGLKEKKDSQKEIAKNTEKILEILQERNK